MRIKLFSVLFILFFITASLTGFAQPSKGKGGPNPCPPNNPNCPPARVPITESIIILVIGGIGIGIKSISKKRKDN